MTAVVDEQLCTAIHEAAHAVVAIVQGLRMQRVSLCDDQQATDAAGYCILAPKPVAVADADAICLARGGQALQLADVDGDLVCYLLFVLAGAEGDARIRGRRSSTAGWSDLFVAEGLVLQALRISPMRPWALQARQWITILQTAAASEVAREWTWIVATAHALIACRTLTVDQVRALRPQKGTTR